MSKEKKYIHKQERQFSAHHFLLRSAHVALEHAKKEQLDRFHNELTVMTMCALALEALVNAFGERFVDKWKKHFENSSPVAKLRVVCWRLEISCDFDEEPWSSVPWLIKFRNRVAHAKPELVREEKRLTQQQYDNRHEIADPKSKLESEITLPNAERAYSALVELKQRLCGAISDEDLEGLYADAWSGEIKPIEGA